MVVGSLVVVSGRVIEVVETGDAGAPVLSFALFHFTREAAARAATERMRMDSTAKMTSTAFHGKPGLVFLPVSDVLLSISRLLGLLQAAQPELANPLVHWAGM